MSELAAILHIPLFMCEIDVAREAQRTGGNVEAIARHERYLAANEALRSMCQHEAFPLADGRIFTAHTADDRYTELAEPLSRFSDDGNSHHRNLDIYRRMLRCFNQLWRKHLINFDLLSLDEIKQVVSTASYNFGC